MSGQIWMHSTFSKEIVLSLLNHYSISPSVYFHQGSKTSSSNISIARRCINVPTEHMCHSIRHLQVHVLPHTLYRLHS